MTEEKTQAEEKEILTEMSEEEENHPKNELDENASGAEQSEEKPGKEAEKDSLEKDKVIAQLNDQILRLMAEFDNYRKRSTREKSELIKVASEDVMTSLLFVIDDFERTIEAIEKTDNLKSIREGMKLVTENFSKALHKKGLQVIECKGKMFDSSLHEAITTLEMGEDKKGKVIDEIEKGYKLNDKVIRFSKVVVGI